MHNENLPATFPHDRHISVKPAIVSRGRRNLNIWVFDSPKNDRRLTIGGDLRFITAVLLEADNKIASYQVLAPSGNTADVDVKNQIFLVHHRDGTTQEYRFSQKKKERKPTASDGQSVLFVGREYLLGKEILFENWLWICSDLTRARCFSCVKEIAILNDVLNRHQVTTLRELFSGGGVDRALMLAAVGRLLQRGLISIDLESAYLGLNSKIVARVI